MISQLLVKSCKIFYDKIIPENSSSEVEKYLSLLFHCQKFYFMHIRSTQKTDLD